MGLLELEELQAAAPIFRTKAGAGFAKWLMKELSVTKLNELYDRNSHLEGQAFADAILKDIEVKYSVAFGDEVLDSEKAKERLGEILPDGPFITISNHPYGSIDGVMLVDFVASVRPDYKVMVNKILGRIEALSPNFITVVPKTNATKSPTTESVNGVRLSLRQVRDGGGLGVFPSGAVSDLSLKDRCIRDREWQMPVIRLIAKAGVPIIPIRFFDGNSKYYYSLGLLGWKVRLLRLFGEIFNKRGKVQHLGVGPIITVEQQKACESIEDFRKLLRNSVYGQ